jgi:FkbM family methyltransferase
MKFIRKKIEARLYAGDVSRMIASGKIPDATTSLERVRDLGFIPGTIFDVGAYEGAFTDLCLRIWPESFVYSFEALPDKIPGLETKFGGKKVKIINSLVGEQNSQNVQFYSDETASSILESAEQHTKDKLNLKMITLDSYVEKENIEAPNFLKIDTQGYEYPILKGFEKNLGRLDMLLLELNFMEIYYGVKLAHEVMHYLGMFGFVVYDVCEIHRRPLDRALTQMDFLFVKEDSHLRKDKRWDK